MAVVFDSVGFSAALDSLKTKVSDKLKSELKNAVTEEAKSELDDKNPNDAQAYTNFYNRVMPAGNFKKNIIPEEVYKAIMLEAAVRDKTISKGFDIGNLDGNTVSAIASWFQGIYSTGEGKDVIYGFENDDLLKITGAFNGTYSKSKSEVYFKVGTTSKAITLTDFSATSFNINGTNYKISGTKLVKK